jgi:uncharacterized protein YebE (UPF0316 family)
MSSSVLLTCVLIVLARVTDVSLDTLRTVSVVQGRRAFSAALGFFEALIYIAVVAQVLRNFDHAAYAFAYAGGFALGTWLGIVVEQHLGFGTQLACFITYKGDLVSAALDGAGYPVARVEAQAWRGGVSLFYVEVPRRRTRQLMLTARSADEDCFCVVNDLRLATSVSGHPIPVRTA